MPWQDIVLFFSQLVFAIALFPSILSKNKPALATSLLNAVFLMIISYTNYTLNLYGAAIGILIGSILWGILAVQKYLIDQQSLRTKDLKKTK